MEECRIWMLTTLHAMIEETNVESKLIEYYAKKNGELELISFSLVDILDDGISMVYSVFNPYSRREALVHI